MGMKMELKFADRMKDFEEGIFQVLNEKKNERLAQGKKVYNLSVGTPVLDDRDRCCPSPCKDSRKSAAASSFS